MSIMFYSMKAVCVLLLLSFFMNVQAMGASSQNLKDRFPAGKYLEQAKSFYSEGKVSAEGCIEREDSDSSPDIIEDFMSMSEENIAEVSMFYENELLILLVSKNGDKDVRISMYVGIENSKCTGFSIFHLVP